MNGFLLPQGFRNTAFPAIATGVYGFPREAAARVAVTTIGSHLEEQRLPELAILVCFDTATFNAYCKCGRLGA
jgi:O-acetyl-ADP-ribose deacetylase